ncbi:uncharacterized protein LOC133030449 [Cannabis sativa]|uniref:uncharacterized protein LOC133030449 n=1 Tax=Cannabis sativa TaxID=3483 RepID=UPI0029C9CE86|nr:uncharacterized protein LOC133030449 [Cannabis sativa]
MSLSYSMWPVIVVPYNLPPWKCMKPESMMLSLLIPGPNAPGKDMDIFLRPLVDEWKELWKNGVLTRDVIDDSIFRMRAAVIWTINDYPAYALMSGWSTKGYKACPTCNEETPSVGIRSKVAYIGHRRFLPMNDPMRTSKHFDGKPEFRPPPTLYSSDVILRQLEKLQTKLPGKHKMYGGVKHNRSLAELNWAKKSIFFELDYWPHLSLRHNLDVMHIEKNVCDSVLGTLLSIDGKSKDRDKARLDLLDMNIRKELHLYKVGNKWKKPRAPYTLSVDDRHKFCQFIKSVRFPDGFAANLSKNVNEKEDRISGLKSHDCHILFQRLLSAGIRPYLKKEIREAITEFCNFFQQLCARTLNVGDLEKLQENIVIILCKLEKIFPPAFFDIMVHLALHLPREAILGGPVHMRWMYPFERAVSVYKKYVRNRARPEGSIAEAYIVNEALTFCSMYFRDIETRFNRPDRNQDGVVKQSYNQLSVFKHVGRAFGKQEVIVLKPTKRKKAEWYILNNCPEIRKYIDEHMEQLKARGNHNLDQKQEIEFPQWFRNRINQLRKSGSKEVSDEIYAIANRSYSSAYSYPECIIHGVRFVAEKQDINHKTQNSGICVPGIGGTNFYGVLEDIIEMSYLRGYNVLLFKCKWYDTRNRNIQEDGNFTSVFVRDLWCQDDPFILASQAQMVFYTNDDKNESNWRLAHKVTLDNMQFHPYDDAEAEDVNANVDELLQVRVNNEVLVDDGDFEDDTLGEYEDEESHLEDDDDTSDYE